jgi:hypothetical protein
MARRKVKVAKTDELSDAAWAKHYFNQWTAVKVELQKAQEQLQAKEQEAVRLRNEIGKSYIAGMEQQQRCAVERIKSWVADSVAMTGFDPVYTRLVNAVVWAVEAKTVDKSEPAD